MVEGYDAAETVQGRRDFSASRGCELGVGDGGRHGNFRYETDAGWQGIECKRRGNS